MAAKFVNIGTQNQKSLVECDDKSPLAGSLNDEPAAPYCNPDAKEPLGWTQDASTKKTGLGQAVLCDPMLTGQIVNDLSNPNRNVVYRYSKAIRACDEAMLDLFRNLVVLHEDGK